MFTMDRNAMVNALKALALDCQAQYPHVAQRLREALAEFETGHIGELLRILHERRTLYTRMLDSVRSVPELVNHRDSIIQVGEKLRLINAMLDRLAEEYNPELVWNSWGASASGRQEELKIQRANENLVIGYFRGRAEVCKNDPTLASEIYESAAAELELGNPQPACLLLRNELENCDSDSRLRDLAPKLRQMLDYLGEIYGPRNVWGAEENLIGRQIDAALDRVGRKS